MILVFLTRQLGSSCIVLLHVISHYYGIVIKCHLSSLPMTSNKETHYLLIYSFYVWKNCPLPLTTWFIRVPGPPFTYLTTDPDCFTSFFADDVLLFTTTKNSQLRFITDLFDCFSRASGLKINLSKSRAFYSAGTPQSKINKRTSITGIRSTASLDKYLGFPILNGRAKRSDFLFIIDKMQSRLAS
jgi:hypothetical protein